MRCGTLEPTERAAPLRQAPPVRLPPFCRQTYLIAVMCGIDLATTLWFCGRHGAAEANPLMSLLLAASPALFVASKVAMTAIPLAFLEWVRRRNRRLAVCALNTVIVAYIGLYAAGVAQLNLGVSVEDATRKMNSEPEYVQAWAEISRRIGAKKRERLLTLKRASSPVAGS
jgi:hypothetical protein